MELRFTRYEHAPNQLWCQRSRGRPFGEKHGPLPVDRTEKMAAAKNPTWSPKTQERKWFSTNHLMGRGYWVWPYR